MGRIIDARTRLVNDLAAAGLTVVTDPRNARPLSVLVEPPTMSRGSASGTGSQVLLEFVLTVLAAPPGNLDSLNWLSDTVDTITNIATVAAINAAPGVYTVGSQELPAYTVTVNTIGY